MILQYEFDGPALTRLSDALDHPISGFVFVPGGGAMIQQKKKFVRQKVKDLYNEICFNSERAVAIENEPADSAAEQIKRFTELGIIDTEI